jgi:hypothetical protein
MALVAEQIVRYILKYSSCPIISTLLKAIQQIARRSEESSRQNLDSFFRLCFSTNQSSSKTTFPTQKQFVYIAEVEEVLKSYQVFNLYPQLDEATSVTAFERYIWINISRGLNINKVNKNGGRHNSLPGSAGPHTVPGSFRLVSSFYYLPRKLPEKNSLPLK